MTYQTVSYAWMEAYVAEVVADVTKADDEQGKRPTAYELSKHLAGVFEGPGDLSTNPEYLDDLGERSLGSSAFNRGSSRPC